MPAPLCAARWRSPLRASPVSTAPPSRCAPVSSYLRCVPDTAAIRHCPSYDPAFEKLTYIFRADPYRKAWCSFIYMTVRHDQLGFMSLSCRPTRYVTMNADS